MSLSQKFQDIADAIRWSYAKDGNSTQATYTPSQMPNTIKDLRGQVFRNLLESQSSVSLDLRDTGLTSIKNQAFQYSTLLREIIIPNTVTYIGDQAFRNNTSLSSIIFEERSSVPFGLLAQTETFRSCTSLESIVLPKCQVLGDSLFEKCELLHDVTVPEGVGIIMNRVFDRCGLIDGYHLTTMTLPSTILYLGTAFQDCTYFDTLYIKAILPPEPFDSEAGIVGAFNGTAITSSSGHIYVPMASVNAYKNDPNWSYYSAIIEGYNFN